ncbi:MAG TPA: GNAT family N-acetyltransferase [Verrucomicrobiae bacterium]|nr:GNAT family N-acetyltransferase [Verrucomicrobiae bacterium]
MKPKIRTFAEHEWAIYKDLRLAALTESPDAFGSTLAREVGRSEADWASRLAAGVNSAWDFPIVAQIDSQPIGLAWGRIEQSNPTVANLYQVWVHPNYRRLGAGQMLLEAVMAWAMDKQVDFLELGVTCGDSPALRLYLRAGFEPVGPPEPIRPGAELLGQHLRLKLRRDAA